MTKPIREIDGARFDDFEGFCEEVSREVLSGHPWRGNLDAFNDILRGGFGTPDGGFVLRWKNAARSRRVLGHEETARWLRRTSVHPNNLPEWEQRLKRAEAREGATLFDIILEIVRDHGPGGAEAEDGVELLLKK